MSQQLLSFRKAPKKLTRKAVRAKASIRNHGEDRKVLLLSKHLHKILGVTPAMASGVADHVWTLEGITSLENFQKLSISN